MARSRRTLGHTEDLSFVFTLRLLLEVKEGVVGALLVDELFLVCKEHVFGGLSDELVVCQGCRLNGRTPGCRLAIEAVVAEVVPKGRVADVDGPIFDLIIAAFEDKRTALSIVTAPCVKQLAREVPARKSGEIELVRVKGASLQSA